MTLFLSKVIEAKKTLRTLFRIAYSVLNAFRQNYNRELTRFQVALLLKNPVICLILYVKFNYIRQVN